MLGMTGIIFLGIWMILIVIDIWGIKKRLDRLEWDVEIDKWGTGYRTTFGYQPTQEKPRRSDNVNTTVQNNGNVAQDK